MNSPRTSDGRAYRLYQAHPCPEATVLRSPHDCRRCGRNGRPCRHLQVVAGFLYACALEPSGATD